MKNKIIASLLTAGLIVVVTGCASTNGVKLVQALAGDPATVQLDVTTVWATVHFYRSGGVTNNSPSVVTPTNQSLRK